MNELDLVTISIAPKTLIATEGETFAWDFSLDQPAPAGGLSLFLPITSNNDPQPGDVEYFVEGSSNITDFQFVIQENIPIGFNLTVAARATEATLVSRAVTDNIAEIDEIFTTAIADGENYRANPEQNQVRTVLTDFPVVSLVSEAVSAAEGNTFAWNFSLNQPAPAGGLSLFLPIISNNDPQRGDVEYFLEGSSNIADFESVVGGNIALGFNLTIAEGATEATLVSRAVTDELVEENEIFTTAIADGENYRANPAQNQVITEIFDTSNLQPPEENFSFEIPNYGLDHQGGAIVDITVDLDFIEGIGETDPFEYPE
ncbi:hypothetical protein, partial [Gloeocapsa sp. PCC 73106]|uniref:hypothetical protein n=1 Tax=Gloeocapsa sp. PCC 73106 TaxID=102232 RepID=UPI0002ABCC69